jgi:nucleotide-binding universal stress UspA family protein
MANILVPFDFSANAIGALDQAIYLAKGKGLTIEVLHILNLKAAQDYPADWNIDPHHVNLAAIEDRLAAITKERCEMHCSEGHPLISSTVRESVMINGGIINHMLENKADLIVMGTHGASNAIERFWGSNTSTIINHSLFPVMAVPRDWHAVELEELIAAISLKEAKSSLPRLIEWGKWMNAKLEVISLTSVPETDQEQLEAVIAEYPEIAGRLIPKKNDLPLWKNIVNVTADHKKAALVMFVHERTVFDKLFDYSITSKVADGIRIPLLAIPTTKKSAAKR